MWLFYFMGIPSHLTCSSLTIVIEIKGISRCDIAWNYKKHWGEFWILSFPFENSREIAHLINSLNFSSLFSKFLDQDFCTLLKKQQR